jgi:hypothetical protein
MRPFWTSSIHSLMRSTALALSTSGMFASFGLADCESVIGQFRESHDINSDYYKDIATVQEACKSLQGSGAYKGVPITGDAKDCNRQNFNEVERVHIIEQARTVQALYAVAAYNTCMIARAGSGFFAWYEPVPNSSSAFTVHFALKAPFDCTDSTSQRPRCKNEAHLRINYVTSPQQGVEGVCPGNRVDGKLKPHFDDYQGTTLKPGQTVVIACSPNIPRVGPLILTFEDTRHP